MSFTGIPMAATDFYAALQRDNTRAFWAAHKDAYERDVREPVQALLAELADEFGEAKVYRPHRDVRFSADKTPYKDHQGGYVGVAEATGWYLQISADGFRFGGGCYHLAGERLAAYRAAVDHPVTGPALAGIVERLEHDGWEITGDQLRTAPRGYSREHPRIRLLRHKALAAMRWIDDEAVVGSPALTDEVRRGWAQLRPLVDWLAVTDR